jgi:thioredoxin 1
MVTELTRDQYETLVIQSKKPVVIDLYAVWCGPCKQLAPQFATVAHDLGDSYNFFKVNVDEEPELAAQFNVTSIPTILFIKNGVVVDRMMGYMHAEDLKEKITTTLK